MQRARWTVLFAAVTGVAVFAVTQISYWLVAIDAPSKHVPVGLASLAMDIYSYYSFIWQAAGGHWVFNNSMTSLACDRVFFNLQWLILGKCMGWFGWSPLLTFQIWRFAGSLVLVLAFTILAMQVLPRTSQRIVAVLLFAFGGGFGWFIAIVGSLGYADTSDTLGLSNPAMDLITPIHPFGQILKNPHYSLPHGTLLLFVAAYIHAERKRNIRWYVFAAFIAFIHGLMRPYDVITLCVLIPAHIGIESLRNGSLEPRVNLKRALPLFASLPLLGYYYYIFSIHTVFEWWAVQGVQLPTSFVWHTLGLGLAGVLFLYRLAHYRKLPFSDSAERFLVVLAAVVLLLYHANHLSDFFSFSPQIGIPVMGPIILVGLGALPLIQDKWFKRRPNAWASALSVFIVINALSSPLYIQWTASIGQRTPRNYVRETDMQAINWLQENARETDVILSNDVIGGRIAFYVNARVALGHWALTPEIPSLKKQFARFAAGELSSRKAERFIAEINPRFIYFANSAQSAQARYVRRNSEMTLVFSNDDVAIYELNPQPVTDSSSLQAVARR